MLKQKSFTFFQCTLFIILWFSTMSAQTKNCPPGTTITVWVHGTLKIGALPMPLKKWHASPPGIIESTKLPQDSVLRKFAKILSEKDPDHFSMEHFYRFGWSGELSPVARKNASNELTLAIKDLINSYQKKYGHAPCLRIITHSHGGNVALSMAEQDASFTVDELVLIAIPVQEKTSHLIKSPMFKKIYSLYSHFDVLQVADPQVFQKETFQEKLRTIKTPSKIFSERIFPPQDNLVQALIRYKIRFPAHLDFIRREFIERLPEVLHEMRQKDSGNMTIRLTIF